MSRPTSIAGARSLSLPEELEKLEQSITLTLQEIDSNFSRAHRIVTTCILPLVEQYGEHSRSVWEATKFWKQFFEASANVSLSGYEELAGAAAGNDGDGGGTIDQDDDVTATTTAAHSFADSSTAGAGAAEDDTASSTSPVQDDAATAKRPATSGSGGGGDDNNSSLLDDGDSLAGSTPRPRHQMADHLASPYETMRRDMASAQRGTTTTPGSAPSSSRLAARLAARGVALGSAKNKQLQQDPLLHRVLDKTYRVGQTPIRGAAGSPARKAAAGEKDRSPTRRAAAAASRPIWADSPGMSSPLMPAPQLRSAAFLSPMRPVLAPAAPRTPGISVQATPLNLGRPRWPPGTADGGTGGKGKGRQLDTEMEEEERKGGGETTRTKAQRDEIHWESDSDDDIDFAAGMSPPKTIQFALPPSKLLQTPAREASRRIVEDILLTAGAGPDDSAEEYSPTMVKINDDILDESF